MSGWYAVLQQPLVTSVFTSDVQIAHVYNDQLQAICHSRHEGYFISVQVFSTNLPWSLCLTLLQNNEDKSGSPISYLEGGGGVVHIMFKIQYRFISQPNNACHLSAQLRISEI